VNDLPAAVNEPRHYDSLEGSETRTRVARQFREHSLQLQRRTDTFAEYSASGLRQVLAVLVSTLVTSGAEPIVVDQLIGWPEGSLTRYVAGDMDLWQLPASGVVALGMYGGFAASRLGRLVNLEVAAAVDGTTTGLRAAARKRMAAYLAEVLFAWGAIDREAGVEPDASELAELTATLMRGITAGDDQPR
jgi:hypothetical protein